MARGKYSSVPRIFARPQKVGQAYQTSSTMDAVAPAKSATLATILPAVTPRRTKDYCPKYSTVSEASDYLPSPRIESPPPRFRRLKQTVTSLFLTLTLYTLLWLLYYILPINVSCKSFDATTIEGNTEKRYEAITQATEDMLTGVDCVSLREYVGKVLMAYLLTCLPFSVFMCGNLRYKAGRMTLFWCVLGVNGLFWVAIGAFWFVGLKFMEWILVYFFVTPAVTLAAGYCLWRYEQLKLAFVGVVFLVFGLLMTIITYMWVLWLLFEGTGDENVNSFLLVSPLVLKVIEAIFSKIISSFNLLEEINPSTRSGYAKCLITVLEAAKMSSLLFTYKSSRSIVIVLNLCIMACLEILTRARTWLFIMYYLANKSHAIIKASELTRFRKWIIGRPNAFTQTMIGSRDLLGYFPLLMLLAVNILQWTPIATGGNSINRDGTPHPIMNPPIWFYITYFLTQFVIDIAVMKLAASAWADPLRAPNRLTLGERVLQDFSQFSICFIIASAFSLVFIGQRA